MKVMKRFQISWNHIGIYFHKWLLSFGHLRIKFENSRSALTRRIGHIRNEKWWTYSYWIQTEVIPLLLPPFHVFNYYCILMNCKKLVAGLNWINQVEKICLKRRKITPINLSHFMALVWKSLHILHLRNLIQIQWGHRQTIDNRSVPVSVIELNMSSCKTGCKSILIVRRKICSSPICLCVEYKNVDDDVVSNE